MPVSAAPTVIPKSGKILAHAHRIVQSPVFPIVLGLVGVAARLRQYLAAPSFWYDEAFLLTNICEMSFGELVGPLRDNQVAPPLFLWMLRALYVALGSGELVMRLPAMAASMAALLLMIPLARRVVGRPSWIWAVGLCAFSNHALAHAYQVKPYAVDFLVTQIIVLAAWSCLAPDATRLGHKLGLAGLLVAGLVTPWFSFPSVFALGGASLALFAEAIRRRERAIWIVWCAFNLVVLASGLILWLIAARYHNSEYQRDAFSPFFMDISSPIAAVTWIVRCLIDIGHYGSGGLGILLMVLGIVGIVALWKSFRAGAVLIIGPIALALLAAALRQYPLGDRLCFFAVPCIWLLAAMGIGELTRRLDARWTWAGAMLPMLLLLPGAVRTGKYVIVEEKYPQFREAFSYVREHWGNGDRLWAAHPHVYWVYFGRDTEIMSCFTPPAVVEQAARTGRVWTALPPRVLSQRYYPELFESLRVAGAVQGAGQFQFTGLEITLYEPAERRN